MIASSDGGKEPSPADRIHNSHEVIGVDAEGHIHHYVKDWGREFITEDGGAIFVVATDGLHGAYSLGPHSLDDWVADVAADCGWDECYVISLRAIFEPLADVVDGDGGDA